MMNIKENILNLLSPLKIYDQKTLEKEIQIYSLPLQKINAKIDELLNEAFVQTAKDYGLKNICELLGLLVNKDQNILQIQNQLIYALSSKPDNFNKIGIENSLKALGFDCIIKETPQDESITISFKDKNFKPQNISLFKDLVSKMLPAHLELVFDINSEISWSQLENTTIDTNQEFSWEDFSTN